jgi:hypothetical protein
MPSSPRRFPPPWSVETRGRSAKTFTPGSFVKDEYPAGEWPAARGRNENLCFDDRRRHYAHGGRRSGGHEQCLQEWHPALLVRSDVQLAAPHKNWAKLTGD